MTEQREWWRSLLDFTPSEYASIGVTGIRNATTDVIDKAVGGTIGLKSNIATTFVFGAADVGVAFYKGSGWDVQLAGLGGALAGGYVLGAP